MSTDTAPAPEAEVVVDPPVEVVNEAAVSTEEAAPQLSFDEQADKDADDFFAAAEAEARAEEEAASDGRERDEAGRFKSKDAKGDSGDVATEEGASIPGAKADSIPETVTDPGTKDVLTAAAPRVLTFKDDGEDVSLNLDEEYADQAKRAALTETIRKGRTFDKVIERRTAQAESAGAKKVLGIYERLGYSIRAAGTNPLTGETDFEVVPPANATPQVPEADPLAEEEARIVALEDAALESREVADIFAANRARAELNQRRIQAAEEKQLAAQTARDEARQKAEQDAASQRGVQEFNQRFSAVFAPHATGRGQAEAKQAQADAYNLFAALGQRPGATYASAEQALTRYLVATYPIVAEPAAVEAPKSPPEQIATPASAKAPPVVGGGSAPQAGGGTSSPRNWKKTEDIPDEYFANMIDK